MMVSDGKAGARWIAAMPWIFVLIWATGFIAARYGMPHAPPMKFLAWRYGLSVLCFLLWILVTRVAWPNDSRQWFHLAVTGVLMHACYLGGVWAAVRAGMGSGLSALIVGLQPVLTALWLAATASNGTGQAGPRISGRQWVGLVLGMVGLAMVVSRKLGAGGEVSTWSLSFALAALAGITVGTVYQKRFVKPCDVRTANTIQLGAAFLVTLPLALLETATVELHPELVGAMAWSVLGLTLGGSSLMFMLIQRGALEKVTSLLYLVPPTTAMMAWVLFGEAITPLTVLGTLVVMAGVWMVIKPGQKAERA
jgi:drug/metabolite transporter (DMT)-like permease